MTHSTKQKIRDEPIETLHRKTIFRICFFLERVSYGKTLKQTIEKQLTFKRSEETKTVNNDKSHDNKGTLKRIRGKGEIRERSR